MTLSCTPVLTNNTIALNHCLSTSTTAQGAGICAYSGSSCNGTNNIVYFNVATLNPQYTGVLNFTYSCCSQALSGTGNFTSNPLFINDPGSSYCMLSQTASGQSSQSPCVDAGNPASAMPAGSTRTDFVPDQGAVDLGYHWTVPFSSWFGEWGDLLLEEELGQIASQMMPVSMDLNVWNYPNPFNPTTTINLSLNESGEVELVVTDVTGRIVSVLHNGYLQSGIHQFQFSGENLATGIYFYQAKLGEKIVAGRALLVK